jgi:hypothetical protein
MVRQSDSKKMTVSLFTLAALALGMLISVPVCAQVSGGTFTGTVSDASGAVIPNAQVTFKNAATGVTRTTTTNAEGIYTVSNLLPAAYDITVSAQGFSTEVQSGITLTVGAVEALNFSLRIGQVTEQVQVTSEAPAVQLASSSLAATVESNTVRELPLNGRDWASLAQLQPGVAVVHSQDKITNPGGHARGLGTQMSINGARPTQNSYRLNGLIVNDYSNAGPGNALGQNLGVDAIQEFSVLTSNYSSEYGYTSGGVINAISRSGTNQFHGSAYEFLRNNALDARNFFDYTPAPKRDAPFRRNQFGGAAGGPIKKDKVFIFGDYEGVRQVKGFSVVDKTLSDNARIGLLNFPGGPSTFPSGCVATSVANQCQVTVDPNATKFLNSLLIPLPNRPVPPGSNSGQFVFPAFQNTLENFFTIRADHNFSEKDRVFVTYLFDKASQSEPDEYASKLIRNPMFRQMVAIEENHVITAQLLNSFRVGFNRDNVESPSGATALKPAAADTGLGFIPGTTVGNVVINSDNLTGYTGGLDVAAPFKFHWNSWQAYDNLFYAKGKHSMKFGANVERIQGNTFGADFPGGQIIFSGNGSNDTGLSDFLTNRSGAINADVPGKVTGRGVRQTIFGAYFQDDTHLRSNLTLNWGVRYEMASVITEADGKLANLRVLNGNPPKPFLGSPYILNPTKRNFEPRVGFAWDPFKNGKTSVAGGFGIFDVLPLPVEMGSGVDGSFPFDITFSQSNLSNPFVLGCSTPCGGYLTAQKNQSNRYYIMEFKPKRNYVMQWNFNVQRQLTPGTTLMVGYVGARGVHMRFQADDVNMVQPTQTSQGLVWPCASPLVPVMSPQGSVINTCQNLPKSPIVNNFMGRTQMALFDGNYFYDGLQLQVKKAMSHGLQVGGSYTWSKNIDTGGGSVASDPFRNSISTLLWFCASCRRGLSDQDMRHNLTANYVWDIPTPASFGGPAKAILGNWEAGGILTIESGTPFTVLVGGDPLGETNTDPFQYPDRVSGPGCAHPVNPQNANGYVKLKCFAAPSPSTRLGNAGRNSVIGPGLVDMDFSLFKNIPIRKVSEAFKAQFRAEIFNIFNRPNFTSPNDNRVIMDAAGNLSSTAGVLTLTNTTSRQIQFALKLSW